MTALGLVAASALMLVAGLWLLIGALVPHAPRLADALELLDSRARPSESIPATGIDRLGAWARTRWLLGADETVSAQLRLRSVTLDRFVTWKILGSVVGAAVPSLLALALLAATGWGLLLPAAVGVVGALIGYFLPDLLIRRGARTVAADATESLLTYVDLVTLERLANRSAAQALAAAAEVSSTSLFRTIRSALDQAKLEQRPPYSELRRLSSELSLPALGDIADVMRLDESGAALSDTLRARVKELRDAHLAAARVAAADVSERMTLFMVIPSMIFGLIFLVPPLLRLVGAA